MKSMLQLIVAAAITILQTIPALAQTTGAGPYYATPSWDQKLQCDTPATCPRFVVLANWNNETVLDRETGLVWQQSPDSTLLTWYSARFNCITNTSGNRKGWRLPTIQELMSLMEPSRKPSLPAGHPFSNVQSAFLQFYWSATTYDSETHDGNAAWVSSLFNGDANIAGKNEMLYAWCVRSGQGVDTQ